GFDGGAGVAPYGAGRLQSSIGPQMSAALPETTMASAVGVGVSTGPGSCAALIVAARVASVLLLIPELCRSGFCGCTGFRPGQFLSSGVRPEGNCLATLHFKSESSLRSLEFPVC